MTETRRGPMALRIFLGLLTALASLGTIALLLSDRAPGIVRAMFGDTARSLWARIDPDRRAAIEATGATEQTDLFVHVAIWAVVTVLAALTLWSWRGLALAMSGAAIASVVVEFGQTIWADTRAFEVRDLLANLVGVGVGALGAACVLAMWSAFTRERSTPKRPITTEPVRMDA